MTDGASLKRDYFEALYARDPDPWRFRSSDYERDKYLDTFDALAGRRFRRAIEVGCSIGELTARLAPACERLLAVDIAEAPLRAARLRNPDHARITFARMSLPDETPSGAFDLIVLSEVLYYWSAGDLLRMAGWTRRALEPGGAVLMVHWLGETPDYPASGDAAADAFIAALAPVMTRDLRLRRAGYRLDRLALRAAPRPEDASPA